MQAMHERESDVNLVPSVKPLTSVECGAWIISDQGGLRQALLHEFGVGPVFAIYHDLHSQQQYNSPADQLDAQKPFILWIRLAGPACGSGNRRDNRRSEFLIRLVLEQMRSRRIAVIEGNVRSEGWNLRAIREFQTQMPFESKHVWCRYQPIDHDPCSATTRICSNVLLSDRSTCLCRTDASHLTLKQLSDPKAVEALVLSGIIQQLVSATRDALDRQPESMSSVTTSNNCLRSGAADVPRSTVADEAEANAANNIRVSSLLSKSTSKINPSTFASAITETISPATARSNSRESTWVGRVPNNPVVKMSTSTTIKNKPSVSFASEAQAYPTEQANRQKERKKAGIQVRKRKQIVEQHQDNMGTDLSSIQVSPEEVANFTQQVFEDEQMFFIDHAVFQFAFHEMFRDADECTEVAVGIGQLHHRIKTYLQSSEPQIHVVELFGGEGLTSNLCSRLHGLTSGKNFEIQCGIDLNKATDRQMLRVYLQQNDPDVVIMAPPCKGFRPWAFLNEIIHPEAVERARHDGVPLARLCAEVAASQLARGKHFLVEQPRNSTMFDLPEWVKLAAKYQLAYCDQCRFGLKNRQGIHLKKPTKFAVSNKMLTCRLDGKFCLDQHQHGKVASEAERWPYHLCKCIASGIADLISSQDRPQNTFHFFPTRTCPGCRGHCRRDDPRHNRDETCGYYKDELPTDWTCPVCKTNKHRSDSEHTLEPNCRWAVASTRTETGRARRGHHPRVPAVRASSEPTARMRVPDEPAASEPSSSAVAADAVEPERLTPEQAEARRRAKSSSEVQVGSDPDLIDAANADAAAAPIPLPGSDERALVPAADQPTWSKYDIGTALQLLRSVRAGVVRRTLRKLHIRWFHAPAKRISTLLTAAGVPVEVVRLVDDIVATCDICRAWAKPGSKSIASSRLPERFNQEVEIDLLFVGTHVILHMIDRCIRWSVAVKLPDRTTDSILDGIRSGWINQYGCPGCLIYEKAAAVLETFDIQLHLTAKNQHAAIVERHNELLRRQIHLTDMEATKQGLRVSFEHALQEATFAKNTLLQHGGFSPYEALYGRTPRLLDVMSHEDDSVPKENAVEMRAIALRSMVQASAEDKIKRADKSRTRPAGELAELQVGDLVDIYGPTLSKDVPRWNGPATVCDLTSLRDGMVRNLLVRTQDCRRALACVFAPIFFGGGSSPIETLRRAAETFNGVMRLGWIRKDQHWIACEGNKDHQDVLAAGLHVAAVNLQLLGVFSFRFGHNVRTVSGIMCDELMIFWWQPPHFQAWCHAFADGNKAVNLTQLANVPQPNKLAFIQFLMEDGTAISQLRKLNIDVANIGGVHEPRMPIIREIPNALHDSRSASSKRAPKMLTDIAPEPTPIQIVLIQIVQQPK